MKITTESDTLRVSDLRELTEEQADEIIEGVSAALTPDISAISLDLTQLRGIDGDTANLLRSIQEEFAEVGGLAWRVFNPPPEARQLFELVRLHHLFEINPPRASAALS
jgi:anti-anti-sigma regulatory factor